MKKSGIILIALIYVASITIVGFLGLKAKSYNDPVYVEAIEILNDYQLSSGLKFIILRQSESGRSLQIECRVTPDDATDKKIIYSLAPGETRATIDENGLLTFADGLIKAESVKVRIYSNMDRTISEEITVYFIP